MARLVIVLAQAQHIQVDPPGFDCGGVIKGLAHRQQGLFLTVGRGRVTRAHTAGDRAKCLHLGVLPRILPRRIQCGLVAIAQAQEGLQALGVIAPDVDRVFWLRRGVEHTVRFGGLGRRPRFTGRRAAQQPRSSGHDHRCEAIAARGRHPCRCHHQ